jgi:formylglycine-generating enzyme required for sulfatase activity
LCRDCYVAEQERLCEVSERKAQMEREKEERLERERREKEEQEKRLKAEQEKKAREEAKRKKREEEAERKAKEKHEKLAKEGNSIGMKFIHIPAGEFMMGSEDGFDSEKPVQKVIISKPFYLGTYPVTQREWKAVMGDNPSYFKGDELPVQQVSWDDVQEFIRKLNDKEGTNKYRLPSEAEWEYAYRGGSSTRYSFGDDESKLSDYAWYSENSGSRLPKKGDYLGYDKDDWSSNKWYGKTHPVGKLKPNPWGLYDIHGNVWEWVQDRWHGDYDGAPTDGSAWEDGSGSNRVSRGGGWRSNAGYCRSANRDFYDPGNRYFYLGFRLLQEL